jgi:hypothetical protein
MVMPETAPMTYGPFGTLPDRTSQVPARLAG